MESDILISDDEEPTAEQIEALAEREAAEARELHTLNLLWDVQRYFGGKYTIIPLYDTDNEDDGPFVELRIADHSGNARNLDDMHRYNISVVISDDDLTRRGFYNPDQCMPNEVRFNGDNSVSEIIFVIEDKIKTIKDNHFS
jgi:hypothetical protein